MCILAGNSITIFVETRIGLFSCVIFQGQQAVNAYFPADLWYDVYDGHLTVNSTGQWVTLKAPLELINVHVKGGSIVTLQHPAVTTTLAYVFDE
jgi:alpha-glucosidase (family GH31 glycosyl hydrolase)